VNQLKNKTRGHVLPESRSAAIGKGELQVCIGGRPTINRRHVNESGCLAWIPPTVGGGGGGGGGTFDCELVASTGVGDVEG
jgi:hypothetical protein